MKRLPLFILLLLISIIWALSGALQAQADAGRIVRVAIADDRDAVMLSLKGRFAIYGINSRTVIMDGPFLNAKVTPTKNGIQIGSRDIEGTGIKVKVVRDSNIYVDNRRFRGDVDILRKDNGKLLVINYIGLEEYLYGVLYHEVSHRWPLEALKAQAIAARTFALYQMRQSKLQPFDVRSDIYSQVYGGRTSEKWSTNRAVDLTKDEVLIYNGDIFPAYYHATCAGHTEDASNLWSIDMGPLKGVSCGYCGASPHYKWTKEVPLPALEGLLRNKEYKIGKIANVSVLGKNASGRVDKIEIRDQQGVSVILTGKDFRRIVGPNELRSTKFDASVRRGSLVLEGYGWGHGVGMCQWGAFGMSRKGKKCEEILKSYYPGAEITNIDKIGSRL